MRKTIGISLALVGITSSLTFAAPQPPVPMSKLVQQADLIVSGALEGIRASAKGDVTEYTASLRVDQVIVGEYPGRMLPVSWYAGPFLCNGSWYLENAEGKQAVWLLQKTADGEYYWWHPDQIWFYEPVLRRYPTVREAIVELRSSNDIGADSRVPIVLEAIGKP